MLIVPVTCIVIAAFIFYKMLFCSSSAIKKQVFAPSPTQKSEDGICIWEKEGHKCLRSALDNSPYCLFHKQDKTKEEVKLFNRVILFKSFYGINNNDFPDSYSLPENLPAYNSKREQLYQKIKKCEEINFTTEDKDDSKKRIKSLVEERNCNSRDDLSVMDFKGFVFPSDISFSNVENIHEIVPRSFLPDKRSYDFSDAIFLGRVSFDSFKFNGLVKFDRTIFKQPVTFHRAIFLDSCSFLNTEFSGVNYYTDCTAFSDTEFRSFKVEFFDVRLLDLRGAIFSSHTNLILKYSTENKLGDQEKNYKVAKLHARQSNNFEQQIQMHFQELHSRMYIYSVNCNVRGILSTIWLIFEDKYNHRKVRLSELIRILDGSFLWLAEKTVGYLLKPLIILRTIVFVLTAFSVIYYFFNNNTDKLGITDKAIDSIYLSFSTFLSLSIDKNYSSTMKFFSILEFSLGFILASLFLISLSRRFLRE